MSDATGAQFGPPIPVAAPAAKPPAHADDTVKLMVAGEVFTGWEDVRIIRGIELFPSHFVLRLTERLPDKPALFPIEPGQVFRLYVGADLVMTGYIDAYIGDIAAGRHTVTVVGRSGCEDLVDAAAGVSDGQETKAAMTFRASTFKELLEVLCKPFGIEVLMPDGDGDPIISVADGIPQFTLPLGQSVYDTVEPIARWRRLLLMDDTSGRLVACKVGTTKAGSGFTLPGTCQTARVDFTKQDRFTIYLPAMFASDRAFEVSQARGAVSSNYFAPIKDDAAFKGQPRVDGGARYRPKFVVSEQTTYDLNLAEYLAKWEMARDFGRSQQLRATVSLWRDAAGTLWTPNTLAPVDIPALKLKGLTWIVAQVEYLKGFEGGTRTVVTLMPPEAFQPEPSFYSPYDPGVAQAQAEALRARRLPPPSSDPRVPVQ